MTTAQLENVYEWMLINCDKLVEAIKEDGKFGGPKSDVLLEEASKFPFTPKLKRQARELLEIRMKLAGIGSLAPW